MRLVRSATPDFVQGAPASASTAAAITSTTPASRLSALELTICLRLACEHGNVSGRTEKVNRAARGSARLTVHRARNLPREDP
jgi:hypothetical protein